MNKLTQMSRGAVTDAQSEARRRNHHEVDTWHLPHALLGQEEGIVPALVEKLDLTVSALQLAVQRELDRLPSVTGSVDASKIYVDDNNQEESAIYSNSSKNETGAPISVL